MTTPYCTLTKTLHFVTLTVVDWIDIFTRPIYNHIVVDSLKYCQKNKSLNIYAWVLMSNHIHLLVALDKELTYEEERLELSNVIRDFKKFTNKKIIDCIQNNPEESRKEWMMNRFWFAGNNDRKIKNYRFWQEGYYPEDIVSYNFLQQKINYIHQNPVTREVVSTPEHFKYSSAIDYAGGKGLLDVIIVQ